MNFKIENNYINITNYPYLERHFEKRAREGWMIRRIIAGNIFIYKKTEPKDLDFSISPYEVESFFSRKSKADLEEFQAVSKYVGWDFATKTYDLHIYYKNKEDKALDLETDEEETFNTLERIAKRYEISHYLLTAYILFMSWRIIGGIFNNINAMKDGLQQILVIILPLGLMLGIYHMIDLNRFLKRNKKNLDEGLPLEFDNKGKVVYQILFFIFYLALIAFISYIFYLGFILKNRIFLIGLLPVVLGASFGFLYKYIIKPWRKGTGTKVLIFILGTLVTIFIVVSLVFYAIDSLMDDRRIEETKDLRVLTIEDFPETGEEDYGDFYQNSSFLIPVSYEYSSYYKDSYVNTEYSKALNESLAKSLVERYIRQAENAIRGQLSYDTAYYLENNIYQDRLGFYGITEEDFARIKKNDRKKAKDEMIKISQEKSIIPADKNQWGLDQVYYLNFSKEEVVLRKGREVFFLRLGDLSDMDEFSPDRLGFKNEEIVELVKDKLDLN